jgi:hypothetical protein
MWPPFSYLNTTLVGAAEGCDLLTLFLILSIRMDQDQKIAAFGSSYRERGCDFLILSI